MAVAEFVRIGHDVQTSESEARFPEFPHLGRMLEDWFDQDEVSYNTFFIERPKTFRNLTRDIMFVHYRDLGGKLRKKDKRVKQKQLIDEARKVIGEVGDFLCSSSPKPEGAYSERATAISAVLNLVYGYMAPFPRSIGYIQLGSSLLAEELVSREKSK